MRSIVGSSAATRSSAALQRKATTTAAAVADAAAFFSFAAVTTAAAAMRQGAIVTGSTDGIGVTTAKNIVLKDNTCVLIHGRDRQRIDKAASAVRSFLEDRGGQLRGDDGGGGGQPVIQLPPFDLSTVRGSTDLASAIKDACAENDLDLTILMNNAGVFSEKHVVTEEGLELTFAVNVLAPFVITSHLLPVLLLPKGKKSRIVIASSISQCRSIRDWDDLAYNNRPYSAHAAYSESKLLDAMLTMEMAARFVDAGIGTDRITCNCLDPGTVNTKMLLAGWGPCGIDVEDALDQMWLCTSDEVEDVTGRYFVYRSDRRASGSAYDKTERRKLWSILSDLAPEAAKMWDGLQHYK